MSGRSLSSLGARPTHLELHLTTSQIGRKLVVSIPLYGKSGSANWMVHPTAGEQVDLIAIPLDGLIERDVLVAETLARPINEFGSKRLQAFIGDELMIVGFPRNLHSHGLPLFKRATFASEPTLFEDKIPVADGSNPRQVLVDSATREGMSGSPVIHVKRSMILRGHGDDEFDDLLDSHKFYGIYSGRLIDVDEDPTVNDFFAAQIGIIWPSPLIDRVVQGGDCDRFEREGAFEKTIEAPA